MIVNCKDMMQKAESQHYAVPQFNINSLEWTREVLEIAQELQSPVILGVAEKAAEFMGGYKTLVGMVHGLHEDLDLTIPVALHLDHGRYESCTKCIDAGFTSIMYDGSSLHIDENIKITRMLADLCNRHDMSLEAEVGTIGRVNKGVLGAGECANPEECRKIAQAGITMLAAGIGNAHGKYPSTWQGLNWNTLRNIKVQVGDMPLVLHGGSGIPGEHIVKAISMGVSKININTECQIAFTEGVRLYFKKGRDQEEKGYYVRNIIKSGLDEMESVLRDKIKLFGSDHKA